MVMANFILSKERNTFFIYIPTSYILRGIKELMKKKRIQRHLVIKVISSSST